MSASIGLDIVTQHIRKALDFYVTRFKQPTRKYGTLIKSPTGKIMRSLELQDEIEIFEIEIGEAMEAPVEVTELEDAGFEFSIPFSFGFNSSKAEGTLDFKFTVTFQREDGIFSQVAFEPHATLSDLECKDDDEDWCESMEEELEEKRKFLLELMSFYLKTQKENSVHTLSGILSYIQQMASSEGQTFHAMLSPTSLNLFFNCKADSVQEEMADAIDRDELRLGVAQNVFDNFGIPSLYFDPDILLAKDYPLAREKFKEMFPTQKMRFVRDPEVLSRLDPVKVQTPQLTNLTKALKARRAPHPEMDLLTVKSNMILELTDMETEESILAVIALNANVSVKIRQGPKFRFGPVQEIKFEYGGLEVELQTLQLLSESPDPKLEEQLASARQEINNLFMPAFKVYVEESLFNFLDTVFASENEYYPFVDIKENLSMQCFGYHVTQPQFSVRGHRLVAEMRMGEAKNLSSYCDSPKHAGQTDPENRHDWDELILRDYEYLSNFEQNLADHHLAYLVRRDYSQKIGETLIMSENLPRSFFPYFSNIERYKKHCMETWPAQMKNDDFRVESCALAVFIHCI